MSNDKLSAQKLFKFELDQSGRVEELNRPTVIGIANKEFSYALRVKSKVKKNLWELFRRSGKTKRFGPVVFEALVILAVRKSQLRARELVIDLEYPGYEKTTARKLETALFNTEIIFHSIGKKSLAHFAAYGVFIGKRKQNHDATEWEMKNILLELK